MPVYAKFLLIAAAVMFVAAGRAAAFETGGNVERLAPDAPGHASPHRFCFDVYFPEGRFYRNTCTGDVRHLRRDAPAAERDAV